MNKYPKLKKILQSYPLLKEFLRALRHPVQYIFLRGVYSRIRKLEYRSFNRRYYAIEQIAEYLVGAKLDGDYCEFGVYQGATFIHAYKWMEPLFPEMRFLAYDSFEGLPSPEGLDNQEGYTSNFFAGQFSCSESEFLNNLKKSQVNIKKIITVKGWFNKSLDPKNTLSIGAENISVAWIDCDLYESTIPVLDYLVSRLIPGSVIAFDDWHCYRNHPDFGQQRAVREWLVRNPQISLAPLFSFGWNGEVFTVTTC